MELLQFYAWFSKLSTLVACIGICCIVEIIVNEAGFFKNCRITGAMHTKLFHMGKNRDKLLRLYIDFHNSKEPFDPMPYNLLRHALQHHLLTETFIHWVVLL